MPHLCALGHAILHLAMQYPISGHQYQLSLVGAPAQEQERPGQIHHCLHTAGAAVLVDAWDLRSVLDHPCCVACDAQIVDVSPQPEHAADELRSVTAHRWKAAPLTADVMISRPVQTHSIDSTEARLDGSKAVPAARNGFAALPSCMVHATSGTQLNQLITS